MYFRVTLLNCYIERVKKAKKRKIFVDMLASLSKFSQKPRRGWSWCLLVNPVVTSLRQTCVHAWGTDYGGLSAARSLVQSVRCRRSQRTLAGGCGVLFHCVAVCLSIVVVLWCVLVVVVGSFWTIFSPRLFNFTL